LSSLSTYDLILTDSLPILGDMLALFGLSRFPQKSLDFYEKTGQMLIDDRRKNKQVRFTHGLTLSENSVALFRHCSFHRKQTRENLVWYKNKYLLPVYLCHNKWHTLSQRGFHGKYCNVVV